MTEYQVELLAPAGSKEAFLGAIHAGADAVYLAGNKYGARAYADNFTTEELVYCIRYAHIFGRKVYLTVNTLMKEDELEDLFAYIVPFYEAGLDACIVQDLGAFQCLKHWFPDMEMHVSTQMTITGVSGAKLLKELGATRIVPARELSLDEIRKIKEETGLEMETFIHGAMCYSYSGQCLFSSILGGRSGNRGRCAQPCRLPYKVNVGKSETKECYPLSLKDMCTIEHIEVLMDAGIDSFKIEGRMKKPEYAAGVTSIYRKYIDLKKKNPKKKLIFAQKDLEQLSKLYIRSERQDGYYFKQNGADMVTLDSPAYNGSDEELLTKIRQKYIDVKPQKKLAIYANIMQGEKAFVMLVCEYLSVTLEGDVVQKAQNTPLSVESIKEQLCKLGDTCFDAEVVEVTTDGESFYSLKALNELRRQAVRSMENMLIEEQGLCAGRELPESSPNDRSQSRADGKECGLNIDVEMLDCSIQKNGVANCSVLPPKKQNGTSGKKRVCCEKDSTMGWSVSLSTHAQIHAFEKYCSKAVLQFERIYLESELVSEFIRTDSILNCENLYIALPYCMRDKDKTKIAKLLEIAQNYPFKGFLIRNLEEYAYLKEQGYTGEICGDASLYIWNSASLQFWEKRISRISAPLELNRKECSNLFEDVCYEKLIYGRIPMMVTANCIAKTTDKCRHGQECIVGTLTDRYQKQFPVAINCTYCMNIVYNSVPISLHKELGKLQSSCTKKLTFTMESEQETLAVLTFYENVVQGKKDNVPFEEYTTAHEKRGVE